MTPYNGPERRNPDPVLIAISEMRVEIADRLGRIETEAKGVSARLTNHSERIEDLCDRATSLESSREYCKGVIKAIGIGVPAFGSLAWAMIELGKLLKGIKGG